MCLESHPVGSQGIRAACPRLWVRISPGLIREQEGTHHPPILRWGPWSRSCSPGDGGCVANGLQGVRSPLWAAATTPTPSFPAQTPHPPLSRTAKPGLRASGAKRLGTIQATPLPPSCGSFQTFAEALRIFLRAGAPPNVGSTPGLVSECKVGHREGGDEPFEDEGWVLQGTASPPAGCALPHSPPSPTCSGHRVLEGTVTVTRRAEIPARKTGSPTRPCHHHVALWGPE